VRGGHPGRTLTHGFLGCLKPDCGSIRWFLQLWLQISIWVLIVSWHDQFVDSAVLAALPPPAFRFAIGPIFIESLGNKPYCMGHSLVFNSDSTNIGPIANLTVGGDRAAKTAQSTYWSCHDMIRTEKLKLSQTWELEMPGFWGQNRPTSNGPGFSYGTTRGNSPDLGATGTGIQPGIWNSCSHYLQLMVAKAGCSCLAGSSW